MFSKLALASTTALCCLTAFAAQPFKLVDATIDDVHSAMQQHQLTCVQLVSDYLKRIQTYDLSVARGAPINAFVSINPNVMTEAQQLDHYMKQNGHFKGPMHCIPVVVKDNIDTVDSPTTSGSLSMLGSQPVTDAFLVKKLKDAGAIIIGKGAMDEFASGMYGISSKSGRVGNAYDPTQNPGGSSSGPAAAVSANFAMVGIGTDNSGSVRIPAAYNGVIGLRPSTGLISQNGIFPRGNTDGVAGPIARTTKDLAMTLSAIANAADPADHKTQNVPRTKSYSFKLDSNYLQHKRIGIITSVGGKQTFMKSEHEANAIFNRAFDHFNKLGATLIKVSLPKFDSNRDDNMAGEVQDVNHYLASFPSTRQNYTDICNSGRTYTFGSIQDCLDHVNNTAKHGSKTYKKAMKRFSKNRAYVQSVMQHDHLDALLMPLNAKGAASYDATRVNTWRAAVSSNSGLPAITLTAGYDKHHMPVGMELIGKMYDERPLINMSYAYTSNLPSRPLPELKKDTAHILTGLSIPEMNNLFTVVGNTAFEKYLKNPKKQMITPAQFTNVVKQHRRL